MEAPGEGSPNGLSPLSLPSSSVRLAPSRARPTAVLRFACAAGGGFPSPGPSPLLNPDWGNENGAIGKCPGGAAQRRLEHFSIEIIYYR